VPLTDADLVARVLARDESHAFAELVRRHQSKVRSLLRKLTAGDHALADDLGQETFLRAYRGLAGYAGRARFSTWLCQIAYNAFLAETARARARRPDTEVEVEEDALDPQARPLLRHDLERAFVHLTPGERAALALTFGQDMTHEDAARILECPLGTLKTNVARGMTKLETHLRAWSPAPAASAKEAPFVPDATLTTSPTLGARR
jgi:RNA polymerase sigma factor (sigma-70 family)